MNALHAILLGIVQGLTEFIPVSSTAHLRIVPALLGWADPGSAFTAVVQLGTLLAVLIYFRDDILRITGTWAKSLRDPSLRGELDARMGWFIGLGTLPVMIFGLGFNNAIETGGRNLYLIGSALIVFSSVLLLSEKLGTQARGVESISRVDAMSIGLAQSLALVPGVSRSGSTITAGLFRGLNREAAARYSFLLSIPAVLLSGLFELRKVGEPGGAAVGPTLVATLLAFVVGYASIAFLLRYLTSHSLAIFAYYRVAIGVLVLILAGTGSIH